MQEIYCSFDGKLDLDNQSGYVIYSLGNGLLQIEFLSINRDVKDEKYRLPDNLLRVSDLDNAEKLISLCLEVSNGNISGAQYFYKGKWWSPESIMKVQKEHCDNNWKKYII